MIEGISILGALVLAFVAFKLFMGLLRIGVIVLILALLAGAWQQGVFA